VQTHDPGGSEIFQEMPKLTVTGENGKSAIPHWIEHIIGFDLQDIPPFLKLGCFQVSYHARVGVARRIPLKTL
jgi:hypothetical protein